MKIVAYYILSEHSRLSEEDGLAVSFGVHMVCAKQRSEGMLEALGGSSGQVPIFTSFPFDPAGDVVEQMRQYITTLGYSRYLEDEGRYEVFIVTSKEGNPPQPTCTAMIIDRGVQARSVEVPDEVQYCLDRGRRWEKLGRMGDAMHCYSVGRDVFGDHPELLLRLGILRLEFEMLLPGALECLRKAHDAFPKRADPIYPLALCYVKLAETEKFQVTDASPARLKELALSLLDEEFPRTSKDQRIVALAKRLKSELEDDAESFFKGE